MVKIYGYTKCTTVKKALKYMDENNVKYTFTDFVENRLSADEIKKYHQLSGLPIKRFFNTSGNLYKELKLKDKVDQMSLDEAYELLATNGMLVKRPLLVSGKTVFVGFKEQEWETII